MTLLQSADVLCRRIHSDAPRINGEAYRRARHQKIIRVAVHAAHIVSGRVKSRNRVLFGRNDFKDIATQDDISEAAKYITKYMEKSGERLVYGGKLPTYFRSDILDEDVVCRFGIDDRKVLLFDNFTCINEGEILGKVNKEIISQLPKCN